MNSLHSELFRVAHRHHDNLILLLNDLSEIRNGMPDEPWPDELVQLEMSVWELLKNYGRRDEHGSVDEEPLPELKPWRPGDDDKDPAG